MCNIAGRLGSYSYYVLLYSVCYYILSVQLFIMATLCSHTDVAALIELMLHAKTVEEQLKGMREVWP